MDNVTLETAIKRYVDAGELAGAAMLVWRGGEARTVCVGWRDLETRRAKGVRMTAIGPLSPSDAPYYYRFMRALPKRVQWFPRPDGRVFDDCDMFERRRSDAVLQRPSAVEGRPHVAKSLL